MNAYKNASFVGFVLYFIGFVLIGYGLTNLNTENELDQVAIKAEGTVYDLSVTEPYRQAWVQFKTDKGRTVRFLDKLFWNKEFNKYTIGQKVEVIYDPAQPEQTATINDFFQRNTAPWWPVILGFIVFLVGWIMRKIMLKKAKIFDAQRNGKMA